MRVWASHEAYWNLSASVCLALGLMLLSGCAVGPRYARPSAPTPPAYKELPPNWKSAQPSDHVAKGKWWEIFQDAQLNALEDQVNISNQSLKAAQAQFEQARALVRVNRSFQFPTVTAGVSATRNHLSSNRPNGQLSSNTNFTDLQFPVDASYEADVWGRVRRTVQAARANAQATAADLETVSLSLHAELASDYFQLRALDAEEQLLNSTVAAYEKALELTENRYKGGIASQVDVAQAQTQLETTRAQAIDLGVQRAQLEHAIAVLTGQPASTFSSRLCLFPVFLRLCRSGCPQICWSDGRTSPETSGACRRRTRRLGSQRRPISPRSL